MGAAVTHFVAPTAAPWLAGTLAVFTTLESVFDLCVGCVVYTYVALPLYKARDAAMAVPWFRDLGDPMLLSITEHLQRVEFAQGARIVTEGEAGAEMFVLREGEIEVFRGEGDAETVVGTYARGDFFGEMALLTGNPRSASVRARRPVVAFKLDKSDFDSLLLKHPGMREILKRTAAERAARDQRARA